MCYTAKESLLAFALIAGLALVIWQRNQEYDRVLASFLLVVSLIQLIEFGLHQHLISSFTGGKLIYLTLWLQPLVLSLALAFYLNTKDEQPIFRGIAWLFAFVYLAFFVRAGVVISNAKQGTFSASRGCSGHIEWMRSHHGVLHSELDQSAYLYGLFAPLILLFFSQIAGTNGKECTDSNPQGLFLFILAGVVSMFWVKQKAPGLEFSSLWCFSAFLMALTAYISNSSFFVEIRTSLILCGDNEPSSIQRGTTLDSFVSTGLDSART